MNINDADFMSGNYVFTGAGNGSVVNRGNINVGNDINIDIDPDYATPANLRLLQDRTTRFHTSTSFLTR